jgi:hypothetical protein
MGSDWSKPSSDPAALRKSLSEAEVRGDWDFVRATLTANGKALEVSSQL